MKRLDLTLIALLWLACAGWSVADDLPDKPRVQVALMPFPGYSYLDENRLPAGKSVQLTRRLLEQAGYAFDIRILPPARIWRGLEDGTVHIWPGVLSKPGLENHTLLTDRDLGLVGINLYARPGATVPDWPDGIAGKRIILITNYTYTNQDLGNGDSQSFQTWNATLSYRRDRDSKFEYEVRATNILDIDSQVRNRANNVSVFISETFIQPRFLTFRLVYSL